MTQPSTEFETRPRPDDDLERARFQRSLTQMNVALNGYAFEMAYARARTAAARSGQISKAQLGAIVDDVVSSSEILQGVAESFR